jgi:hypothetical protein
VPVLIDRKPRPWSIPQGGKGTFAAAGYHLGKGGTPLEVAVATSPSRPTESDVRNLWKRRKGNQPSPLLLVVLWPSSSGERATVCGATGDEPAVYSARDPDQVERVAALALSEPDHHAAVRFLSAYLPEEAGGLRNVSLFATYHLVERVPRRPDWPELCKWGPSSSLSAESSSSERSALRWSSGDKPRFSGPPARPGPWPSSSMTTTTLTRLQPGSTA